MCLILSCFISTCALQTRCMQLLEIAVLPTGTHQLFDPPALFPQVTLSYGMFENKRNSIHMKGAFSVEEDPSR